MSEQYIFGSPTFGASQFYNQNPNFRQLEGRDFASQAASYNALRPSLADDASIFVPTGATADFGADDAARKYGSFFNKYTVQDFDNYIANPDITRNVVKGGEGVTTSVFDKFTQRSGIGDNYNPVDDIGSYMLAPGSQDFIETPTANIPTFANTFQQEGQQRFEDRNKGGWGEPVGKALKIGVPLAIGAVGTLGLGTALGGLGAAGATGVSAGNAAASTGSSFLGGLGSSFAPKAALSGALKGGIGGFLSGGDFSSALKGAGLGGLTGGFGSALGTGLGLQGAGLQSFTGALQGASGGLAQGDLKNAGLGAILGGAGGYLQGGGKVPGFGSFDQKLAPDQFGPPKQGTGFLGKAQDFLGGGSEAGGLSSLTGGNNNMLGQALKIGGSIYSQGQTEDTNEDIRRMLMEAQGRAEGALSPYAQAGSAATNQLSAALQAGFNPQDLQSDPGYQFRLQQGQQALDRRLAAQGMGQSGAALKAAQEYGQGLASTEYNDAYNRWMGQNSQLQSLSGRGLGAADSTASLYGDMGAIEAQMLRSNQESRNKTLSDILSGVGSFL